MSEQEPNEPYIYQPFGFQHEMGKRLYGIGGLHTLGFPYGTKVDGFTSEEASKILTVIKNFKESVWELALVRSVRDVPSN